MSAQQSSSEAGTLHDSFMQDALKLQKAHVKTNRKVRDYLWCPAFTAVPEPGGTVNAPHLNVLAAKAGSVMLTDMPTRLLDHDGVIE